MNSDAVKRIAAAARAEAAAGRPEAAKLILLVLKGQLREREGDFDGALAAYEEAIALSPGTALCFSRRAVIRFRLARGDPRPAQPRDPARPSAAFPSLGNAGRFGNQLLQYGLLRLYAAKAGAQALAPDWIGRDLFGLTDALTSPAPAQAVDEEAALAIVAGRASPPPGNVALSGFFCGDTSAWASGKEFFQGLFEPAAGLRPGLAEAERRLAARGRTLVALHLRRGDFCGDGRFWIAPSAWYLAWLEQAWSGWDAPVLYIATDDPKIAAEFSAHAPLTAADLGEAVPGAEFFIDHWVLRRAGRLAVSNSSFSITAALLNRSAALFLRPDRALGGLREFDPWKEKVLLD